MASGKSITGNVGMEYSISGSPKKIQLFYNKYKLNQWNSSVVFH